MSEPLATVSASAPRRLFGLGVLLMLGGGVIYLALVRPPELYWQIFLLVFGGLVLWLAQTFARATTTRLELSRAGLRSSDGALLVPLQEIEGIERGVFALKPSNGFTLKTRRAAGRAWAPGLWWRLGRRVGVGGVTSAPQAKAMAEILSALLAERDA